MCSRGVTGPIRGCPRHERRLSFSVSKFSDNRFSFGQQWTRMTRVTLSRSMCLRELRLPGRSRVPQQNHAANASLGCYAFGTFAHRRFRDRRWSRGRSNAVLCELLRETHSTFSANPPIERFALSSPALGPNGGMFDTNSLLVSKIGGPVCGAVSAKRPRTVSRDAVMHGESNQFIGQLLQGPTGTPSRWTRTGGCHQQGLFLPEGSSLSAASRLPQAGAWFDRWSSRSPRRSWQFPRRSLRHRPPARSAPA
jgi:hypothetical protein